MRRLLVVVAVIGLTLFALSGSALAFPNLSQDGTTCTPCHTDGRTGEAAKPAGGEAKAAPAAPAEVKQDSGAVAKPVQAKVPAPVATQGKSSKLKVTISVLGQEQTVDAVKNGSQVLLPARTVVEAMGGRITNWDNKAKALTIAYGSTSVTLPAASILNRNIAYLASEDLIEILGGTFNQDTNVLKKGKSDVAREQWATTKHNIATLGELTADSPSKRDNCVNCHDGVAFANQKSKRADLPNPELPVGQDCQTCHGERGKSIQSGGTAELPAVTVTKAGAGALCMTCHNGRKVPTPGASKLNAPHGAAKADVLTASGGWEVAGVSYPSSPHLANPDSCVSCHMAENQGIANHTFKMVNTSAYAEAACGSCHPGLTTFNRTALADYDGNGVIAGIQDEVAGLIHLVEKAIKASLAGGAYGESHGGFEFYDAGGNIIEPTEAQYMAAWNVALVEVDASGGVHNPAYVIKLLQESYKQLTGKVAPNAALR